MPHTPSSDLLAHMWQAASYQKNAGYVPALGMPVLDLLNPSSCEHILDLGCGDGALTLEIAHRGASVLGVDLSPDMVLATQQRGLQAQLGDGTTLNFTEAFDAVFSNAALHWMKPPDLVLKNVYQALKPNGRFVAECGGHGNIAAICVALTALLAEYGIAFHEVSPWYFPSPLCYKKRLTQQGLQVEMIELIPRPTPLPTGLIGWLSIFGQPFIRLLPEAEQASFYPRLEAMLHPILCDEDGQWVADYVRLRFVARKP